MRSINVNEDQLRQYIELQRKLIEILRNKYKNMGHTMQEIAAIQALQDFEDTLLCNQK